MDECIDGDTGPWQDLRFIPGYASAASLLLVLVVWVVQSRRKASQQVARPDSELTLGVPSRLSYLKRHVKTHGGTSVYTFNVLRFLGSIALVALAVARLLLDNQLSNDAFPTSSACLYQWDIYRTICYVRGALPIFSSLI